MKLYEVTYYTWNMYFSDLDRCRMFAVGKSSEDAIQRAKKRAERGARDFRATEITKVMGYEVQVCSSAKQKKKIEKQKSPGSSPAKNPPPGNST